MYRTAQCSIGQSGLSSDYICDMCRSGIVRDMLACLPACLPVCLSVCLIRKCLSVLIDWPSSTAPLALFLSHPPCSHTQCHPASLRGLSSVCRVRGRCACIYGICLQWVTSGVSVFPVGLLVSECWVWLLHVINRGSMPFVHAMRVQWPIVFRVGPRRCVWWLFWVWLSFCLFLLG